MSYLVAIDHGSTALRAVAYSVAGEFIGVVQKELRAQPTAPGHSEYAPAEILAATVQVSEQLMFNLGIAASDVVGIGIANQRDTIVVWNRLTGDAIGAALAGDDWRALELCQNLAEKGFADTILDKTGQPLAPYLAAPKLAWILDHNPQAARMAARGELAFGTIESWLVWQLTGGQVHVIDATNASRTLLYNLRLAKWDGDLLRLFGVPESVLPAIVDCSVRVGLIQQTGHPLQGVPILAIATDESAALFGQGCLQNGDRQITLGSSCNLMQLSGQQLLPNGNLGVAQTVAWQFNGVRTFALEEQIDMGGAMIDALIGNWHMLDHISQLEHLVEGTPYNEQLWMIPPRGVAASTKAKGSHPGALLGWTRVTERRQILSAALESIAFQVTDGLRLFDEIERAGRAKDSIKVSGAAAENRILLQMLADFARLVVLRSEEQEPSSWGVAAMAGLQAGIWKTPAETALLWRENLAVHPAISSARAEQLHAGWLRAKSSV